MGRHVLIVNRFDNESGEYHRHIDHRQYAVAYITNEPGSRPVDRSAAQAVEVVEDLADRALVEAAARALVDRFGPFDDVLALSEFDLETGAWLRERLGVAGPTPEQVRRVRDKIVMKNLVSAAGLRVPRFVLADSPGKVRAFAAEVGFPLVLKPRAGWDSQGVFLVHSAEGLDELLTSPQPFEDYECEEFVSGQMYHVDGLARDGRVQVARASRLLVHCLQFALGNPFGSLSNDDPDLEGRLVDFAQRVVEALDMGTSAFHLELFRTEPAADGSEPFDDLVFLEVGGRVGGAQIPFIWREVYGLDLVSTWVRMLVGESPELPDIGVHSEAGGYLMMPEPPVRPCVVRAVTSQLSTVPTMYAEVLPEPGTLLNGTGGARETAGRFRYRAPTAAPIEAAIEATLAGYHLDWEPIDETAAPARRPQGRVQAVMTR